jgi:hypothetical protein
LTSGPEVALVACESHESDSSCEILAKRSHIFRHFVGIKVRRPYNHIQGPIPIKAPFVTRMISVPRIHFHEIVACIVYSRYRHVVSFYLSALLSLFCLITGRPHYNTASSQHKVLASDRRNGSPCYSMSFGSTRTANVRAREAAGEAFEKERKTISISILNPPSPQSAITWRE